MKYDQRKSCWPNRLTHLKCVSHGKTVCDEIVQICKKVWQLELFYFCPDDNVNYQECVLACICLANVAPDDIAAKGEPGSTLFCQTTLNWYPAALMDWIHSNEWGGCAFSPSAWTQHCTFQSAENSLMIAANQHWLWSIFGAVKVPTHFHFKILYSPDFPVDFSDPIWYPSTNG